MSIGRSLKAAFDYFIVRREGLTRDLAGDVVERFFALRFALEQMGKNSFDLERCISEWAEPGGSAKGCPKV